MFKDTITKVELQEIISSMSEIDVARFLYCQEIAGTYLAVGRFESTLILAMLMCDKIKLQKKLGSDLSAWNQLIAKKKQVEDSTIGSLIKILDRHELDSASVAYLGWLKNKRDYFIHRLLQDHRWPGDLGQSECRIMRRRLLAIQLWLERGEYNIWLIFEKAGLIELDRLSDEGFLSVNTGIVDVIHPESGIE